MICSQDVLYIQSKIPLFAPLNLTKVCIYVL